MQFNKKMADWLLQHIDAMPIRGAEATDFLVIKQALSNYEDSETDTEQNEG